MNDEDSNSEHSDVDEDFDDSDVSEDNDDFDDVNEFDDDDDDESHDSEGSENLSEMSESYNDFSEQNLEVSEFKKDVEIYQGFLKAVKENNEKEIDRFLERIENVNKSFNEKHATFIHIVAKKGTTETAKKLIDLGADVNVFDHRARLPLWYATQNSFEIVQILLENGAEVNTRGAGHKSPIFEAVKHSSSIVNILLKYGAKVNIKDYKNVTPLEEALLSGSIETILLILNQTLLEIDGSTAVQSNEEMIDTLLKRQQDLNLQDKDFPLLIMCAAKIGDKKILQKVLQFQKSGKKSRKRKRGSTKKTSKNVINYQGFCGRTVLHYAVREDLPEVVRFLLSEGADANSKTKDNFTPLNYAAGLQNENLCRILLSYGALVNQEFNLLNPLYLVCGSNSFEEYLKEDEGYYFENYNQFTICQRIFNSKIAILMLQNGANPNTRGQGGMTPLLEACQGGNLTLVRILLEFGGNLQAVDDEGNCALHYAAKENALEIVDFLLANGFDVDVKNEKGYTPLHCVIREEDFLLIPMIEYLVRRGADVNARNFEGVTPLHLAVYSSSYPHFLEILLEFGADAKLQVHDSFSSFSQEIDEDAYYDKMAACRKMLIAHFALTEKELGDYVNCYFEAVEELPKGRAYFKKAQLEVEKLKATKLCKQSGLSFYDFLQRRLEKIVPILENESISKLLKTLDYEKTFPRYSFFLCRRLKRASKLKKMLNEAENFLVNYGEMKLPILVIRKILNYLENLDLLRFVTAVTEKNLEKPLKDERLQFGMVYESRIVEIQENGVLLSLFPDMPALFCDINEFERHPNVAPLSDEIRIGNVIYVTYFGNHPVTGHARFS